MCLLRGVLLIVNDGVLSYLFLCVQGEVLSYLFLCVQYEVETVFHFIMQVYL
jgi:hypothetical protein